MSIKSCRFFLACLSTAGRGPPGLKFFFFFTLSPQRNERPCCFFFVFSVCFWLVQAFRPGATDMPAGATVAAPGAIEAQGFGDFDDVGMDGVNIDVFSK